MPLLRIAVALLAVALAVGPASATAQTVESNDPSNTRITTESVEDTIRLLRIAALSLKDDKDRGRAFAGLVEAQLERDKYQGSQIEYKNIRDPLWRARSDVHIADYHLRKGRTKTALKALNEAAGAVPVKNREKGANDTFRDISLRQARTGDFAAAQATARRVSIPFERAELLIEIGDMQARNANKKVAAGAVAAYDATFALAKTLKGEPAAIADVLLRIVEAYLDVNDAKRARTTLEYLRAFLLKNGFDGRDDRIARLAGAYVLARDNNTAMQIVRTIKDTANRCIALSSVAGAIGKVGSIDAAVPLFQLAFQDSERIESVERRYEVIAHLVHQQALVARNADAFKMAGWIRAPEKQAFALLAMAEARIAQGDYKTAMELVHFETKDPKTGSTQVVNYIPYIGMRSRILTAIALVRGRQGDRMEASRLLAMGLADTWQNKIIPESLQEALMKAVDTQAKVGAPEAAASLFSRVRILAEKLPKPEAQVAVLTQVATAFAAIDKPADAKDVLDVAWRITWRDTNYPGFARMLSDITEAQLAGGAVLQAFDTAARVPEAAPPESDGSGPDPDALLPVESPKSRALRRVAIVAATQGKPTLSIRAVRAITSETARAQAVAEIAVAVAKAEKSS